MLAGYANFVRSDKGSITLIAQTEAITFSAIFHASFACSIVTIEKSVFRAGNTQCVICDKGSITLIACVVAIAFSTFVHTFFARSIVTVEKSVARARVALFVNYDKGSVTLIARVVAIAISAIDHTNFACSIVIVKKLIISARVTIFSFFDSQKKRARFFKNRVLIFHRKFNFLRSIDFLVTFRRSSYNEIVVYTNQLQVLGFLAEFQDWGPTLSNIRAPIKVFFLTVYI
jgi:hypothetical protein